MKQIILVCLIALALNINGQNEVIPLISTSNNIGDKMIIHDFNNSGTQQIVLSNGAGIFMTSILEYDFSPWIIVTVAPINGGGPFNLEKGDLNGDGSMDFCYSSTEGLFVYLNQGGFIFDEIEMPWSDNGSVVRDLGIGDIDGDGDLDISLAIDAEVGWMENVENWVDYEYHELSDSEIGLRGSVLIDWDENGKLDIVTFPGGVGFPQKVFLQTDDAWLEEMTGVDGGVYAFETADIDGDGDLDAGMPTNAGVSIVDLGSGAVQSISYWEGIPDGGQFVDVDADGDVEWFQSGWSTGIVAMFDFENGSILDPVILDFNLPGVADLLFYDGNDNGQIDMFWSSYFGDVTLGVVPDIIAQPVNILEADEANFNAFYRNGFIEVVFDGEQEFMQLYDMNGKIILQEAANGSRRYQVNDMSEGIYFVRIRSNDNWLVKKIFVSE